MQGVRGGREMFTEKLRERTRVLVMLLMVLGPKATAAASAIFCLRIPLHFLWGDLGRPNSEWSKSNKKVALILL